ncbi:MAG: N-acetyltransferase [Planctomycetales bacterium]|nr:N-acetyltransferase [Planctomycetales bacterium]
MTTSIKRHPQALVESDMLGPGTCVWAFAHVMPGAQVGANCNIGDHAFIEGGVIVGDNVTIKNHVCLWEGVTVHDDVFLGPHVVFTNDLCPRSPRMADVREQYSAKENWLARTLVQRGCSVGANATIVAGITLGAYCMVGAGATVVRDVPPHALVVGTPARQIGWVCRCGHRLVDAVTPCGRCGRSLDSMPTPLDDAASPNRSP